MTDRIAAPAAPTSTPPFPTRARQWWLVGVLTVASTLAYIDKNVVALMVGSIQHDLGLRPAQVTLAIGTAFAVANILVSVPAGWLADRSNRRAIVWIAMALWSCMTILCGNANGLIALLLTRGGVGLAEGMLPPACYSMIRDAVTRTDRARALGIFSMSNLVGTGLAFLGGGLLLGVIAKQDYSALPLVGHLPPWGLALVATGSIGLPLSLLVFTVREPVRAIERLTVPTSRWRELAAAMWALRRVFVPLAVFSVAHAMLTNSINLWVTPLLMAKFGMKPAEIGLHLGLILLTAGPCGLVVAGALIDRLDRGTGRGTQIVAVAVAVILLVSAVLQPLAPTPATFWICQASILFVATTYLLVTSSLVARVLPPTMTGRAIALFLLVQGLLGVGVAPTLTALAIETLFAGAANPIAAAMSATHGVYAVVALAAALYLYRQRATPAAEH